MTALHLKINKPYILECVFHVIWNLTNMLCDGMLSIYRQKSEVVAREDILISKA